MFPHTDTARWWTVTGHFSFTGGFWMNNTATHSTTTNTPCPTVRKQIGKTTYIVRVHFSQTAKETMEDKIKRLLREEVRKMWLLFEFDEKVLDFSSLARRQNPFWFLLAFGWKNSIFRRLLPLCAMTSWVSVLLAKERPRCLPLYRTAIAALTLLSAWCTPVYFRNCILLPTMFTQEGCQSMCIAWWTNLPMGHSYKDDNLELRDKRRM